MDLLLAGWSLRDVGHRLSWWDLRTFIRKLKPDSYLHEHLNPDGVLPYRLSRPETQILGEVHDRILEGWFVSAGQYEKAPKGLISRVLDNRAQPDKEVQKKRLSPREIRARVAASMR